MNKLARERSTYLQQHAENPVDWYPYGREAFQRAEQEGKLIFLSIGYSSCHWCHVMARESFQDEETALFLNDNFVCIKVDREERPGVDKVYQEIYQLVNQRGGGWPLSVWMTPDAKPIFLGTYFPNKQRHNMPSFKQVCERILHLWNNKREAVLLQASELSSGINFLSQTLLQKGGKVKEKIYLDSLIFLKNRFDHKFGGIGSAPKFPRFSTLRFLLAMSEKNGEHNIQNFVSFTIYNMLKGGIYDQIGGGISRYSVDNKWLIPHFEKMLYDNAGLLQICAELYAITGDEFFQNAIDMTIRWLNEEMKSSSGGYYASLNAESEGREGRYYVWQEKEFDECLGANSSITKMYFGVTKKGNFRDPHHPDESGFNVLSISMNEEEIADIFKIEITKVQSILNQCKSKLLEKRNARVKPERDSKKIGAWNALLATSFFSVFQYCRNKLAKEQGLAILKFILEELWDGKTLSRYSTDEEGRGEIEGGLDDYSFLVEALLLGFETSGDIQFLTVAYEIFTVLDSKFYSPHENTYYLLPPDSEEAMNGRPIQVTDDSIPSALAVMVKNLFKLGKYFGREDLVLRGKSVLEKVIGVASIYPGATSELLLSGLYYLEYPVEFVYYGKGGLEVEFLGYYTPTRLVYRADVMPSLDVLEGREQIGDETLYICRNMTCSLPILTEEKKKLRDLLQNI